MKCGMFSTIAKGKELGGFLMHQKDSRNERAQSKRWMDGKRTEVRDEQEAHKDPEGVDCDDGQVNKQKGGHSGVAPLQHIAEDLHIPTPACWIFVGWLGQPWASVSRS